MNLLNPRRLSSLMLAAMAGVLILGACTSSDPTPTVVSTATTTTKTIPTLAPTQPVATEPSPTVAPIQPTAPENVTSLEVKQPDGKVVYWVTPGVRRIDPDVFGTPDNPQMTGEAQIAAAQGPVKKLLQDLPILVGLPVGARTVSDDGTTFVQSKIPTPFGDKGLIVSGSLDVVYMDNQTTDTAGNPTATEDKVDLSLQFTDPQGHDYEVKLKTVFMPPIPGYETQGGVIIDGFHHGATGTGSPLMPLAYTYGAFWGVGDVYIDGALADQSKVTHCMTTNTVRDQDYQLALDGELPLPIDGTIAGQVSHTHCIVLPVTITAEGPLYAPVKTAFKLPNGEMQPFIHMMFEQDEITTASNFTAPTSTAEVQAKYDAFGGTTATRTIEIDAAEFSFDTNKIDGKPGETINIVFKNTGALAHNLTFEQLDAGTETIQSGQTTELTITLPTGAEAYPITFYCSVPGHREAGMTGQLATQ